MSYKLYAVINHSGTLYAGHCVFIYIRNCTIISCTHKPLCLYVDTACVKERNRWFICDDEFVTEVCSVEVRYSIIMIVVIDKLFLFAVVADVRCVRAVLPPSFMISSVVSNNVA